MVNLKKGFCCTSDVTGFDETLMWSTLTLLLMQYIAVIVDATSINHFDHFFKKVCIDWNFLQKSTET